MKESDSQRIKSKPTIVDVARLAGVSFKTVSRVINNQSYVGDATRTRVLEAIDALSFVPNMGARTIRGGRHMTIALLFPERKSQYQMEVQDAALGACRNAGYHLIAESLGAEVLQNKDQIAAQLSDLRVSGFIVMPPVCDSHELIETLQELSLPYSRLAPGEHLKSGAEVVVDDAAAVRTMVDHLWSLGHRRIGFIVGNASHTSSRIRLGAFLDHFARLAGTVPLDMVRQGISHPDQASRLRPTCLTCPIRQPRYLPRTMRWQRASYPAHWAAGSPFPKSCRFAVSTTARWPA